MANLLYQQIEMISREKHIEPEVIVAAIEDAMVVAARKFYKTEEDLRGKFNPETGQVDVFSVLTVVEEVTDPKREITLADAQEKKSERRSRQRNRCHQAHRRARAHRGANGQASDLAEGARSRTRHDLQRISHARGRTGEPRS